MSAVLGMSTLNYVKKVFEVLTFKINCMKNSDIISVEELVINSLENLD